MEYKFRGYDAVGSKGWVYGDLTHNQRVTRSGLVPRTMVAGYEVFPDSVGLSLGINDSNGKEIFTGDVVTYYSLAMSRTLFGVVHIVDGVIHPLFDQCRDVAVIGNEFEKTTQQTVIWK